MIETSRRNTVGTALVVLALVLFVLPALFPVQPVLTHDTRESVPLGGEQLEDEGFEIISYENLSERGQELYVKTLESGGSYSVPAGEGAPEFEYPTDAERREAFRNDDVTFGRIVIERPKDDSDLPSADEREFGERRSDENRSEFRDRLMRYDAMETGTDQPNLGSTAQLIRLVSALLAVISLGIGGYLLSST